MFVHLIRDYKLFTQSLLEEFILHLKAYFLQAVKWLAIEAGGVIRHVEQGDSLIGQSIDLNVFFQTLIFLL